MSVVLGLWIPEGCGGCTTSQKYPLHLFESARTLQQLVRAPSRSEFFLEKHSKISCIPQNRQVNLAIYHMRGGLLDSYNNEHGGARVGENGMSGEDSSREAPDTQLDRHQHHYQRAGYAMDEEEEYSNNPRGDLQHPRQPDRFSWFVLKLTVTSALGGFLFGYDTGVVSGAMLLIKEEFSLSDWQEEVVVSVTIAAAVTAAVSGGPAMEQWGRRPLILLAAIVFTIGAVMLAAATSYGTLVSGRWVN